MKINSKVLSIPPYISTAWENVASLHVEPANNAHTLIVDLISGQRLEIPQLDHKTIQLVFEGHEKFLEQKGNATPQMPFQIGGEGMAEMSSAMQHNPEQSDMPDLPPEMLEKVSTVASALGVDQDNLPKAEPHCNCVYCQIARAMGGTVHETEPPELIEEVSDDELKFREWDIKQLDAKLYEVANPLDKTEHYQVFLGNPIGCTCGNNNCEHIKAVLNS
ncbi:MAG: hypothetical protein MRY21_08035 [Simkaniaceae bacterium]|nr:hypothetical protein [Simkaniaceae bacterium]